MRAAAVVLAAWLASASPPSPAQDAWRCESADGKVSYAVACPPGTAAVRALPPASTPSDDARREAQMRARQDLRQVAQIERARKADEERAAREHERAAAQARKQENHCRRLQTRLDAAKAELAGATRAQQRTEAQRRVKRAEGLYVADCEPPRN